MGLNLDDYQNEETWITGVRRIQTSEAGPIRTSGSAPRALGSSTLTTYSISDVLQGKALYKPKAQTLDLFNQTLSKDFEGLRTEKYFVEDKALSPYDVFIGVPNEEPDVVVDVPSGTPAPTPSTPGVPPGQTYVVGDSLTVGLHIGGIENKLNDKGYTPNKVNADGGRSISGPGMQIRTSGFQAVTDDASFIKDCKHVIVALGTNGESNFEANLVTLMGQIHTIAPGAKLWWVDVAASGINHSSAAATNRAIYGHAGQDPNYTVISQYKFLWGEDKDPQTYDAANGSDPQGLLGGDGIHYSGAASYGKYADFIVSKLPVGGTTVTGTDNKSIIWNYFVAKNIPPFQIAGIMGNMQSESGFSPDIIEGGSHGPMPTSRGYGIVQWTPGTKILPAANAQGKQPSDIIFQLDFLWESLTTGSENQAGRILFATTNITDATLAFEVKFERHAGPPQPARIAQAKTIYKEFTGQDA